MNCNRYHLISLKIYCLFYSILLAGDGNIQSYVHNLNIVATVHCSCRNGTDNAQRLMFIQNLTTNYNDVKRTQFKTV